MDLWGDVTHRAVQGVVVLGCRCIGVGDTGREASTACTMISTAAKAHTNRDIRRCRQWA